MRKPILSLGDQAEMSCRIQNLEDIIDNGTLLGFVTVDSVADLPKVIQEKSKDRGYIIGKDLYVYVGPNNGDPDTPNGQYKNVGPFKGQDGDTLLDVSDRTNIHSDKNGGIKQIEVDSSIKGTPIKKKVNVINGTGIDDITNKVTTDENGRNVTTTTIRYGKKQKVDHEGNPVINTEQDFIPSPDEKAVAIKDGVGIKNITQRPTTPEESAEFSSMIEFQLTDGNVKTVGIPKGAQGLPGTNGKDGRDGADLIGSQCKGYSVIQQIKPNEVYQEVDVPSANATQKVITDLKAYAPTYRREASVPNVKDTLSNTAIRKTKQVLSENEKATARQNIGAVAKDDIVNLENQVITMSEQYNNIGPERLAKSTLDLITSGGKIENHADDEDIESVVNKDTGLEELKLADKEYTPENFSGLGRKTLRKNITGVGNERTNVLTQEMISKPNTRYIIQYDYDLQNQTITIPEGCVLDFQGGSFNNGTIVFTDTTIQGDARIYCDFNGTINGNVNIAWFGTKENDETFDNAPIINKVCLVFKNVYLNGNSFTIKEPIIISSMKVVNFDTSFKYRGISNVSAIIIEKSANLLFNIRNISGSGNTVKDNEESIGLNVINCNNSSFTIGGIYSFNNCLRISGIGSGGCSYNHFKVDSCINGNELIRLYQNDKDGNLGWCNQNTFEVNRLTCHSGFNKNWCAIKIKGGDNDSYNNCNGITFLYTSIEGNGNESPVQITNGRDIKILNYRSENTFSPFLSIYGNTYNAGIVLEPSYGGISTKYDNQQNSPIISSKIKYATLYNNNIWDDLYYKESSQYGKIYFSNILRSISLLNDTILLPVTYTPTGIIVDFISNAFIKINTSNSKSRFCIGLIDENGKLIKGNGIYPNGDLSWDSNWSCYGTKVNSQSFITYIEKESNISKLFIGVLNQDGSNEVNKNFNVDIQVSVKSCNIFQKDKANINGGLLKDIPEIAGVGSTYLSTDTNTMYYYNGKNWNILNDFNNRILYSGILDISHKDKDKYVIHPIYRNYANNIPTSLPIGYTPYGIFVKNCNGAKFKISTSKPLRYAIRYFRNSVGETKPSIYPSSIFVWYELFNCYYVNGINVNTVNVTIPNDVDEIFIGFRAEGLDYSNVNFIIQTDSYKPEVETNYTMKTSGTTEEKPTENIYLGQQYFDTTLGKLNYWNGTQWVDAMGSPIVEAIPASQDTTA